MSAECEWWCYAPFDWRDRLAEAERKLAETEHWRSYWQRYCEEYEDRAEVAESELALLRDEAARLRAAPRQGELKPGWLTVELDNIEAEIAAWPEGLRQSFAAALAQPSQPGEPT